MANIKISNLPVASSVSGSDSFPVVQSSVTKQATKSVLFSSPTFTGTTSADIVAASGNVSFDGGTFVFNESGADKDARFEGDTDANLLFLDASTDQVGVGTATPGAKLNVVANSSSDAVRITQTGAGNALVVEDSTNPDATPFVIDAGGRVGVGTVPDGLGTTASLQIRVGGYTNNIGPSGLFFTGSNGPLATHLGWIAGLTFESNATGVSSLSLVAPKTVTAGSQSYEKVIEIKNTEVFFYVQEIERLKVTATGYLRMASGTSGIQFNGDTSASNALNDYEEGTWTPVLSDASTGGNVAPSGTFSGSYTKVGRIVTVTVLAVNFDTTGMTAGNDLFIQGLPFTARSVANTQYFTGACTLGNATVLNNPVLSIQDNTSYMRIAESVVSSGIDFMIVSEFTSGSANIYGTITYETA